MLIFLTWKKLWWLKIFYFYHYFIFIFYRAFPRSLIQYSIVINNSCLLRAICYFLFQRRENFSTWTTLLDLQGEEVESFARCASYRDSSPVTLGDFVLQLFSFGQRETLGHAQQRPGGEKGRQREIENERGRARAAGRSHQESLQLALR